MSGSLSACRHQQQSQPERLWLPRSCRTGRNAPQYAVLRRAYRLCCSTAAVSSANDFGCGTLINAQGQGLPGALWLPVPAALAHCWKML